MKSGIFAGLFAIGTYLFVLVLNLLPFVLVAWGLVSGYNFLHTTGLHWSNDGHEHSFKL